MSLAMDRYDDHLLAQAEHYADPPASCDGCGVVFGHASELYEHEDRAGIHVLLCPDCAPEGVVA